MVTTEKENIKLYNEEKQKKKHISKKIPRKKLQNRTDLEVVF